MNHLLPRTIAAALLAVVCASASAITTWTYTGVSDSGDAVSGWLSFDTSALRRLTSPRPTTQGGIGGVWFGPSCAVGSCVPRQGNPPQIAGQHSDGRQQISVGWGAVYDSGEVWVTRNEPDANQIYKNVFQVIGRSQVADDKYALVSIYIFDLSGAGTSIFNDTSAGLDPLQGISWSADGATAGFWATVNDSDIRLVDQTGYLTSVVVSSVPEPATGALLGMALLWLFSVRLKRSRVRRMQQGAR